MKAASALRWGIVALALALAPAPSAVAGTDGTELQRGVIYESAKDDRQQVGFWVVGPPVDGETTLAFDVEVHCKKLVGYGTFLVRVGDDGKLRGKGDASSAEANDGPETDGEVTVRGEVANDGTVSGTVGFELVEHNEQDTDDVYSSCEKSKAAWSVGAGVPDPAVARVAGFVELPSELRGAEFDGDDEFHAVGADADAVYFTTDDGATLHRVIGDTGEIAWSSDLGQLSAGDVVVGAGFVWADGNEGGAETATTHQLSLDDGTEVATFPGSYVAQGPNGDVWLVGPDRDELRRIDPATGQVAATLPIPASLGPPIRVGIDGMYATLATAAPTAATTSDVLARFDPASGTVLAMHDLDDVDDFAVVIVESSAVWIVSDADAVRLDPRTLSEVARSDEGGDSVAAAPPGIWIGGFDGVSALGPTGTTDVLIPWLSGEVVSSGSTVWLIEPVLGLVRIDASA